MAQSGTDGTSERRSWSHCSKMSLWPTATVDFQERKFVRVLLSELGSSAGSVGKASAYNAGDLGLIPGLGRSPGEGNGNPLQYSCLENPMD